MSVFYLVIGIFAGYFIAESLAGKKVGDRADRSLRIFIGENIIYIHHWMWCSAILFLLIFFNFYSPIVYGILTGSILQGFTYDDWFKIIYLK